MFLVERFVVYTYLSASTAGAVEREISNIIKYTA